MQVLEAPNLPSVYTYTTDYEPYVDHGVFDLPKNCKVQGNRVVFNRPGKPSKREAKPISVLFPQL